MTVRIAVLDTETTGLDPQTCDITELAYIVLELDGPRGDCEHCKGEGDEE